MLVVCHFSNRDSIQEICCSKVSKMSQDKTWCLKTTGPCGPEGADFFLSNSLFLSLSLLFFPSHPISFHPLPSLPLLLHLFCPTFFIGIIPALIELLIFFFTYTRSSLKLKYSNHLEISLK